MSDRFDIQGRVAVVTGGAGLLGREYVRTLCRAGARVVIADANGDAAQALAEELSPEFRDHLLAVRTDVADKGSVHAMVRSARATFGGIDILVNNAALDPKFDKAHAWERGAFEDFPLEAWTRSLDVNVTGMFLCAQAVSRPMLDAGRGVMVNVSSTYGLVGPDQRIYERPGSTLPPAVKPVSYSVTKSAAIGLTRYLAAYFAGRNIRVNTLTPGGVFNDHDDEFVTRYSARTILGRMADRTEYCEALHFLVSDASSYMTGANLVVDGGWTAW